MATTRGRRATFSLCNSRRPAPRAFASGKRMGRPPLESVAEAFDAVCESQLVRITNELTAAESRCRAARPSFYLEDESTEANAPTEIGITIGLPRHQLTELEIRGRCPGLTGPRRW
jgi:hypothetical protein